MNRMVSLASWGLLSLVLSAGAEAAVCTSVSAGDWNSSARWNCGHIPVATDTVVIAHNAIRMRGNYTVAGITVNAGAVLNDDGNDLTVNGNVVINGQLGINQGGALRMRTAGATLSGTGSVQDITIEIDAANITLAAGSTLNFDPNAEIDVGANNAGSLIINGTVTASTQALGDRVIRVSSGGALTVGATGVINAPNSRIDVRTNASLLNNGNITVSALRGRTGTPTPVITQGVNANLTLSSLSCDAAANPCVFNASASGNTVTFNGTATPITPVGNTYYNLGGASVICPHGFTVMGSDPCPVGGPISVIANPGLCVNDTTVGAQAWAAGLTNVVTSDNLYATSVTATAVGTYLTNYLKCTGYGFAIPAGATINGISVKVERNSMKRATAVDNAMRVVKAGVIGTMDRSTTTVYKTTDIIEPHGGAGDLWGQVWTPADINAANFGAAFSASMTTTRTGAKTLSVDHMPITVTYTPAAPLHHIRIEHNGGACSGTSAPAQITLKACNDAACTIMYTAANVTGINLAPTGGNYTLSPANPQTITSAGGGINSGITLARSNAGTATLALTGTPSPAPANAYECYNTSTGVSGDCALVFSADTFSYNVPDHTSGTAQLVTLTSCKAAFSNKTRAVKFWSSYTNPATGTLQGAVVAGAGNADCTTGYAALGTTQATATSLNLSFGAGATPQATFSLCYPDVGNVKLDARYDGSVANGDNGAVILGNDAFIAGPDHFTVSNIKRTSDNLANPAITPTSINPENDTKFLAAGYSTNATTRFTATVTAQNARNTATPNYGRESVPEGVSLTAVLVAPAGGNAGVLTCRNSATNCVVPGGAFVGGAATLTDLAWSEAGILQLRPLVADAAYLTMADVATPLNSANVGRFYPHHFGVTQDTFDNRDDLNLCSQGLLTADGVTPCVTAAECVGGVLVADGVTACVIAPAFTYMGEPMNANFSLVAENVGGTVTRNYTGGFVKLNPIATNGTLAFAAVDGAASADLTARLDTSLVAANGTGSFVGGTADISVPISIVRGLSADGPYAALDAGIAPVDSDGVTTVFDLDTNGDASADHTQVNSSRTEVRYGRTRISSSYGSELLPLLLPVALEYWQGTSYVTSSDDNLSAETFLPENYQLNLAAGETTLTPAAISNGRGNIGLSAPGAGNDGSLDVTVASPAYLPGNTARATFGVYGGNSVFIYRGRRGR